MAEIASLPTNEGMVWIERAVPGCPDARHYLPTLSLGSWPCARYEEGGRGNGGTDTGIPDLVLSAASLLAALVRSDDR